MSLTVVSESTNSNLTRLETVKRELSISSTDYSSDKLLWDMIGQASDYIRDYTDRDFHLKTLDETMPSKGGNYLVLTHTPIKTINYIELDGSSIASTLYEVDDPEAGVVWKEGGFDHTVITRNFITAEPTRYGRRDWKVRYQAGYNLPGSTGRDLPRNVERACIEIVKSWYSRRQQDGSVRREEVGDAVVEYFEDSISMAAPKNALDLLAPYRRHYVGLW